MIPAAVLRIAPVVNVYSTIVMMFSLTMAAPLIVARSDLLMTGPSTLIRYFAELVPLQVLRPPIELPTYPEEAYWHERFDTDPAHTWLRQLVKKTASSYGLQERPRKRSW